MKSAPHVHVPFEMLGGLAGILKEHDLGIELYLTGKTLDSFGSGWDREILKHLDHNPPLTIHGPFMDLSPGGVDTLVRGASIERYRKTLEAASTLNAKGVVFHSGYEKWRFGHRADIWLERSIETWTPLIEIAKKAGIKIAMENIFEDTPDNLIALMEKLGSAHFGICFDTGHYRLFSKEKTLQDWILPLREYILELHLHDNDGTFDQHRPMGECGFPFKTLFEMLKDRDIIHTIEAHSVEDALLGVSRLKDYLSGSGA